MTSTQEPTTAEQWRPVVGFPVYEVSDQGRVRSRRVPGLVTTMSPRARSSGHLTIGLRLNRGDAQPRTQLVHRLVMAAFVGPCPEGMEVCHNDGVPSNNALSNLRYDTASANQRDAVRHGTHHYASRTQCSQGHAFTPENTGRRANGSRRCRECYRESGRRLYRQRAGWDTPVGTKQVA